MPFGVISGKNAEILQKQQTDKQQREKDYQEQRKSWKQERMLEELDKKRYAREAGRFPGDKR